MLLSPKGNNRAFCALHSQTEVNGMYLMPIMFLPYLMFSAWLDFWAEALQNKSRPHVRDPLADKGAGDISSAALDAHARTLPQSRYFSALA